MWTVYQKESQLSSNRRGTGWSALFGFHKPIPHILPFLTTNGRLYSLQQKSPSMSSPYHTIVHQFSPLMKSRPLHVVFLFFLFNCFNPICLCCAEPSCSALHWPEWSRSVSDLEADRVWEAGAACEPASDWHCRNDSLTWTWTSTLGCSVLQDQTVSPFTFLYSFYMLTAAVWLEHLLPEFSQMKTVKKVLACVYTFVFYLTFGESRSNFFLQTQTNV